MAVKQERTCWHGPVGRIEVLIDRPQPARGVAVIAPPNPTLGGTAEHKVPAMVARRLVAEGWWVVRVNYRGVGASEGAHDDGVGEAEDLVAVARRLADEAPRQPLVLIGFSFGAVAQIEARWQLLAAGLEVAGLVLLGTGAGAVAGSRTYAPGDVPPDTLVIHGEQDERVPLERIMRWAETQSLPVVVMPGADHFFSRRLPTLAGLVAAHLARLAQARG